MPSALASRYSAGNHAQLHHNHITTNNNNHHHGKARSKEERPLLESSMLDMTPSSTGMPATAAPKVRRLRRFFGGGRAHHNNSTPYQPAASVGGSSVQSVSSNSSSGLTHPSDTSTITAHAHERGLEQKCAESMGTSTRISLQPRSSDTIHRSMQTQQSQSATTPWKRTPPLTTTAATINTKTTTPLSQQSYIRESRLSPPPESAVRSNSIHRRPLPVQTKTTTTAQKTTTITQAAAAAASHKPHPKSLLWSNSLLSLPENARDSAKKERPFPIPIRKPVQHPDATDPPAGRATLPHIPDPQEEESSPVHQYTNQEIHQDLKDWQYHLEMDGEEQPITTTTTSTSTAHDNDDNYDEHDSGEEKVAPPSPDWHSVPDNQSADYGSYDGTKHTAGNTTVNSDTDDDDDNTQEEKKMEERSSSSASSVMVPTTAHPPATAAPFFDTADLNTTPWPPHAHSATATTAHWNPVRTMLRRPFGRSTLDPAVARQWVVEVSVPEWEDSVWKYRILVQTRPTTTTRSTYTDTAHSLTAAFCWRSLADFVWLEQALHREFDGGLLVPLLSIALQRPTTSEDCLTTPVEAEKLRHWLSDILNGVRGQGEVILQHHHAISFLQSEAMEAFFYKSSGPLSLSHDVLSPHSSPLKYATSGQRRQMRNTTAESFLSLFSMETLCGVPNPTCDGSGSGDPDSPTSEPGTPRRTIRSALPVLTCASRALGSAPSLDVLDSLAETASLTLPPESMHIVDHTEVIEAERDLLLYYRKLALQLLDQCQKLCELEESVGLAWKRLSISLCNLFSYEKDVETAKLGDVRVQKHNMPFRKLSKSTVDEGLRVLAKHRVERSVPALQALSTMLSAYVADLSAVGPSVDAFRRGLLECSETDAPPQHYFGPSERTQKWEDRIREAVSDVKTHAIKTLSVLQGGELPTRNTPRDEVESNIARRDQQDRLAQHAKLLSDSLTALCQASFARTCRMAWKYWNTEASQCASLHTAATALRIKVSVAKEDSVSRMVKRHMLEEKEDDVTEMELVQRIVNISTHAKFSRPSDDSSVDPDHMVEVDHDDLSQDHVEGLRRDRALQLARENLGRWDATVGIAVMEAVGIEDAGIRVKETTRDLRLVVKYALGLRDHLNRCVEAVHLLQAAVVKLRRQQQQDNNDRPSLLESRHAFLINTARLFSGQYIENPAQPVPAPVISILTQSGIDMNDRIGWRNACIEERRTSKVLQKSVGDYAAAYDKTKDSQVSWLLSSLLDLLDEYYGRIAIVECFIHMECVGIQIEKYFNQKRVSALAAFERKTDIASAMNVAKRKRLPKLVKELEVKLKELGPGISHTLVKETKEAHLESKNIKAALHSLAVRRLTRAREASTERAITLISLWAKEEESSTTAELKALSEAMTSLETDISKAKLEATKGSSLEF
jgi:hypothetical protein